MDDYFLVEEALLLAINEAAAEEKVDDGLVEETEEDEVSISPSSSPPVIIHSPPSIRVLPPVEMMVENEIWQYRYPPFDNIFAAVKEHEHDEQAEKAKLDFLPSYVIGVLDPAELVDGLFSSQQRTPTHGDRNSVHSVIDFPGPVSETDDNIRGGKRAFHQQQSPLTPDGGSRSILVPDDRWVWPSSLQP